MWQRTQIGLVTGQCIHPALAGRGKHGREGLLEPRLDAGLVAQPRQFVIDQPSVEGKDVEQGTHVFQRGLVTPDRLQPLGDGESQACTPHQHDATQALRMADGQLECKRTTE
ncbi:hypothetical protein SDC9_199013 [bioreactor metagenome]|uniref:Uncharacterized protein n=1 Tax=bioreactor metagenome TaxID=1076179 RepID=A0A645IJQ9_9ZZZZ